MSPKRKPKIDLVIPVLDEVGVIEQFHKQVTAVLDGLPFTFCIYYIDDGSTDGPVDELRAIAASDARVIPLILSRNFGHQSALTAGLDTARGDFVISLDGDGQHPPEMIPQMIALFEQGYDVVQAQRVDDASTSAFKRFTSSSFYTLINSISGTQIAPGAADFRGMSRQAVDALKAMPEFHRFLRGMVSYVGFKSVILPYHEVHRMAGRSKYSLGKMFRLAMDATADAIFLVDLATIAALGMWLGLTTRRFSRSIARVLFSVLALPWIIFFVLIAGMAFTRLPSLNSLNFVIGMYFVISLLTDLFLFLNASGSLTSRFREIATQKFDSAR